ncbi:MAG: acetyl-CoA carboxylase biotin carboxyl carrier protein [Acidobacteria bacterium]|nr:MAG: acetyl-CoA carboxylase biotin carboxyl carrier protein [Acidobacteriota bacterium]
MSDAERVRKTNRLEKNARRRNFGNSAGLPEPSVNLDELRELIALLRDNGLAEFELEREGFRVRLRRDSDFLVNSGAAAAPPANAASAERESHSAGRAAAASQRASAQTAPSHPGAQAETAASEDQDLHIIPSPIVGTFYRAASPNAEPFVKIGSRVAPDTVVCIIEAMKLMNEIQAETGGEVVKIYVENGQPVEYGQPLFGLRK